MCNCQSHDRVRRGDDRSIRKENKLTLKGFSGKVLVNIMENPPGTHLKTPPGTHLKNKSGTHQKNKSETHLKNKSGTQSTIFFQSQTDVPSNVL